METQLKNLIETKLNIPAYNVHETITFPSATIDLYQISPVEYGDGKPVLITAYINIDLWYKDRTALRTAVDALIPELVSGGYEYPDTSLSYESSAKCYRATLTTTKGE